MFSKNTYRNLYGANIIYNTLRETVAFWEIYVFGDVTTTDFLALFQTVQVLAF
jgi:hypothetical protein